MAGGFGTPAELQEGPVAQGLLAELRAALTDEVLIDGRSYPGCGAYASDVLAATPVEVARTELQERYAETVLARMPADSRRTALNEEWGECMRRMGFEVSPVLGAYVPLIEQRAEQALEALAAANRLNDWQFNEWLHGKTGEPSGMAGQSWNAATYILAYHALQHGVL